MITNLINIQDLLVDFERTFNFHSKECSSIDCTYKTKNRISKTKSKRHESNRIIENKIEKKKKKNRIETNRIETIVKKQNQF